MRRFVTAVLLVVGVLALTNAAVADPGDNGQGKKQGKNRFTFILTAADNGSCDTPWANDVIRRTYSVKDNGDGTFTLRRTDKGTFTTIGGPSPGACETGSKHGHLVRTGVTGRFGGYIVGTVKASAFNP